MKDTWQLWLEDLFSSLDREQLLADWGAHARGKRILLRCPSCDRPEAYIFPDGMTIYCPRENNCTARRTSLLELVSGITPTGSNFFEAVKRLCSIVNVPYQESKSLDPKIVEGVRRKAERLDILAEIQAICTPQLPTIEQYTESRGFTLQFLETEGFGYLHRVRHLGHLSKDRLVELGFYVKKENNYVENTLWDERLLIPLADIQGRVVGFAGRSTCGTEPKYINTRGTSLSDIGAVGLGTARRNGNAITVVEGWLDVFSFRQQKYLSTVAIGTTGVGLSPERLVYFYDLGIRHAILAFDGDDAGRTGTAAALTHWDKAPRSPELYVKDPAGYAEYKDPDAYLRCHSLDDWNAIPVIPGDTIRARIFADNLELADPVQRGQFLQRCIDYDAGVQNPGRAYSLLHNFWPEVQRLVGADGIELLHAEAQRRQRERGVQEFNKATGTVIRRAQTLSGVEAFTFLQTEVSTLQRQFPHVIEVTHSADEDEIVLQQMASREYIGIPQCTLPALDEHLLGLRGLITLAGGTNIGKTILLVQVCMDCISNNPDVCCIYVSLEMSSMSLRNRMRCRLGGISFRQLVESHRGNRELNDIRLRANYELKDRYYPRFKILNPGEMKQPITRELVLRHAAELQESTGCSRCVVVIDHLGLWDVPENVEKRGDIAAGKWVSSDMIALRDGLDKAGQMPVIGVTEVRKNIEDWYTRKDIIGTVRGPYNTETLLIWNRWTDDMLYQNLEFWGPDLHPRNPPLRSVSKADKGEPGYQLHIDGIKKEMAAHQVDFGRLTIDKVRDGGTKGDLDIRIHWGKNNIIEVNPWSRLH